MKRTNENKGTFTKSLLAGLVDQKSSGKTEKKGEQKQPTFVKTSTVQPDLYQDSGSGYNSNLTFIQD